MQKKLSTTFDVLCKGLPTEFITYLTYCRNLRFEDKPDYMYLRNLLKDLFIKQGYELDYQFDWNILAQEKKKNEEVKSVSKITNTSGVDSKPNERVKEEEKMNGEGLKSATARPLTVEATEAQRTISSFNKTGVLQKAGTMTSQAQSQNYPGPKISITKGAR